MNQPIEQRFAKLEQRVDNLERLEQKLDFTSRDVSYKTDMAQGFLRQLQENDMEIKQEIHYIRTDMHHMRTDTQRMESKLDIILQLLQPKHE